MREMKDSGIVWIGEIPAEWSVNKVKHGFYRSKSEAHQENPVVLSLARSGVKVRDMSNNEGQMAESYYNYNPVMPGDLLLNPMDLYSGANCSVSEVSGVISPAYINLRHKKGYCSRYFDYYFKTQYWAMAMFAHGKGVSFDNRWTLGIEELKNYYIPMPCEEEQKKIATFLDMKCAQIDNILLKTRDSIEEYKKLKQSIITQAVTKGVWGDREMKDSGIEWIGQMPLAWKRCKLKNVSVRIGDGLHGTPEFDDGGDVYFINGNNIGQKFLEIKSDTKRLSMGELEKYHNPVLNDNTIMITLNGATYGKVSLYKKYPVLLGKSAGYITLIETVCREYVRYYLMSSTSKLLMLLSLNGTTIQNLSLTTLNNFPILLPPIEEQQEIARYLDVKVDEVDALIKKKEQYLLELESYQKSLIYEYVTGKKEVPETWA